MRHGGHVVAVGAGPAASLAEQGEVGESEIAEEDCCTGRCRHQLREPKGESDNVSAGHRARNLVDRTAGTPKTFLFGRRLCSGCRHSGSASRRRLFQATVEPLWSRELSAT